MIYGITVVFFPEQSTCLLKKLQNSYFLHSPYPDNCSENNNTIFLKTSLAVYIIVCEFCYSLKNRSSVLTLCAKCLDFSFARSIDHTFCKESFSLKRSISTLLFMVLTYITENIFFFNNRTFRLRNIFFKQTRLDYSKWYNILQLSIGKHYELTEHWEK